MVRHALRFATKMAPKPPHNPEKLVGTKWTAVEVELRRKHWEVVSYQPDTGEVSLRAVLDGAAETIPWRHLRDRSQWRPGWE